MSDEIICPRMYEEEIQQQHREELEREHAWLKVHLAQIQSDAEIRNLQLSVDLELETERLRGAISQSQSAERDTRDLARRLGDEVSELREVVRAREDEKDRVKANIERTREQRSQMERTLEVLGGRKAAELLNSRRPEKPRAGTSETLKAV